MALPVTIDDPARRQSATPIIAQVAAAALLGLIALPAAFGGASAPDSGVEAFWQDIAWLVFGLLIAVWLLVIRSAFVQIIATGVMRLAIGDERRHPRLAEVTDASPRVAAWLVASVYLVLIQGIVRRPFVGALGTSFDRSTVDAAYGAVVATLLLVMMWGLYRSGRRLVEATVWTALDAVVATTGSERTELADTLVDEATQAERTAPAARTQPTSPRVADDAQTLAAPKPVDADAPTVVAPRPVDPAAATLVDADRDATVLDTSGAPGQSAGASDASGPTVAQVPTDPVSTEATVPPHALAQSEATIVAPPDAKRATGSDSPGDDATIVERPESARSDTVSLPPRDEGDEGSHDRDDPDQMTIDGDSGDRTLAFDANDTSVATDPRDGAPGRSRSPGQS